ncbi:fimbrial protein [Stenotrophomonas sp.]|uniref:fimbrial protein n=1 Tax=Stenotrophomonas sp. TaxID=69392 RepID=UPI00289E57B4|nr:fimbrial protein [Stenotrophomonas sp.]
MPLIHICAPVLIRLLLVVAASAASQSALASCRISPLASFVAQDIDLSMGPISVPPGLPVNGVIAKRTFLVAPKPASQFICGLFVSNFTTIEFFPARKAVIPPIFATDVPGVGVTLVINMVPVLMTPLYYPGTVGLFVQNQFYIPNGTLEITFIKTAEVVGSGQVAPAGLFSRQYLDGDGPGKPVLTASFRGAGTSIVPPTCKASAGSVNIAVDLGKVSSGSFTGVGSVSPSRDFSIDLDCGSLDKVGATIGVRLEAAQDVSGAPGVLRLAAGADSAQGVGIQLLQRQGAGESQVRFAENIVLATAPVSAGRLSLPMRARYMQTQAGKVTPGKGNGVATFTIQYN